MQLLFKNLFVEPKKKTKIINFNLLISDSDSSSIFVKPPSPPLKITENTTTWRTSG